MHFGRILPDMSTTIVRPVDPTLRSALHLALLFAAIKFALHIAANLWEAHIGYGYFRDELYYIICGRHLAWGYVDHGPGVAIQANLALALFGKSLAGIRMLSAAGGAARVFLTGILAWSLGGRRPAQGLAMICVLIAPQYLGTDSYLSMNSFESLFWMTCLLALIPREIRTIRSPASGGTPRQAIAAVEGEREAVAVDAPAPESATPAPGRLAVAEAAASDAV